MSLLPLPGLDDPEGPRVPGSLPQIVDAHVHLFPDGFFRAIWKWLDRFAWPVRYKLTTPQTIDFLISRGVRNVVGLHYAHRPGVARHLNAYMAETCAKHPEVIGTATVFPGEQDAGEILKEGLQLGLKGVKLHAHVQYFHMDSPSMHEIYEICATSGKLLVMHVGREPRNPEFSYTIDPYVTCRADKLERVLKGYPTLKVCVPHFGADEYDEYRRMMEQYDNLWLDLSVVMADYVPDNHSLPLREMRADRILYGTDFPNIPYAWDRELRKLCDLGLPDESMKRILGRNAMELYGIAE